MEQNIIYAKRKLSEAVYSLATGGGDVRARLFWAHRYMQVLSENHFPKELKKKWLGINTQLSKFGTVQNTLKKIRNSTGVKIAIEIYELKTMVEKLKN